MMVPGGSDHPAHWEDDDGDERGGGENDDDVVQRAQKSLRHYCVDGYAAKAHVAAYGTAFPLHDHSQSHGLCHPSASCLR